MLEMDAVDEAGSSACLDSNQGLECSLYLGRGILPLLASTSDGVIQSVAVRMNLTIQGKFSPSSTALEDKIASVEKLTQPPRIIVNVFNIIRSSIIWHSCGTKPALFLILAPRTQSSDPDPLMIGCFGANKQPIGI